MKIIHPIVKIALFILTIKAIEPPLWPERFSQSMTVNFGDLITTGKYWYDSVLGGQRYDFQNGNTRNGGCGSVHRVNTTCSYLIQGGWFYMVYPQINLCCKLYETQILSRNWLSNYTFLGQQEIDGELFEVWNENLGSLVDTTYFGEKGDKKRPRRQNSGKRVYLDYWMESYSEKEISPSVFQVPSYCLNRCWGHFQSQDEFLSLVQNLKSFNSKILSKSSIRFQSKHNQLTVS